MLQDHAQRSEGGSSSGSNQAQTQILAAGKKVAIDWRETERCAAWYPNQDIVVVKDIGKPPLPPDGFAPLRVGHQRSPQAPESGDDESANGFSLDTLLWTESLLEERLMELTAWTRRAPLSQQQKLDRVNWILSRCSPTNANSEKVLHAAGMEKHFDKYSDDSAMPTKVHNLELLGQTLEALGHPLPLSARRAIIIEDRSAILQLSLQLKDLVQRRKKKPRDEHKLAKTRIYDPRKPAEDVKPPRDLEERFMQETIKKFHPREVGFEKDVNMTIHLRAFEQAQWARENELDDWQQNSKADQASSAAAQMGNLRTHFKQKEKFMQDWDQEHKEKWSKTQRLFMQAERDDLRLELTLAERKRLQQQTRLHEIQRDAVAGVTGFENNMSRMGLGSAVNSTTDIPLRAIRPDDSGPLAHLHFLEKQVEELSFRPSNNLKMMKELRERRRAQLAAEADRRRRRRKTLADQKRASIQMGANSDWIDGVEADTMVNQANATESSESADSAVNVRELYLESKRADLEANYDRLRESGTDKRETDIVVLKGIRERSEAKAAAQKLDIVADAVDALINLVIRTDALQSPTLEAYEELKRETFLTIGALGASNAPASKTDICESNLLAQELQSFSSIWSRLPLDSAPEISNVNSSIQTFLQEIATSPSSLDTNWTSLSSFHIVSIITCDVLGASFAARVALEHSMEYLILEDLLEESVKFSYDSQKQADAILTFSDRQRELGQFGLKISAIRQKGSAVPESLAVDVMVAAILLARHRSISAESDEGEEHGETEQMSSNHMGCILHNFPRSTEEAKLLEKALLASSDTIDEEEKLSRLTALETMSARSEPVGLPFHSSLSAAICLTTTEEPPAGVIDPADNLASDTIAEPDNKKRASVLARGDSKKVTALAAAEAQVKADQEEESNRQKEKQAQLEGFWSQSTCLTRIDPLHMNDDVVVETMHLAIDVFTRETMKETTIAILCDTHEIAEELLDARERRRATLGTIQRVHWMKAAGDLDFEQDSIDELPSHLDKMDQDLQKDLSDRFGVVRRVLYDATAMCTQARATLVDILGGTAEFQSVLDDAAKTLAKVRTVKSQRERVLTDLEVALGDLVDTKRLNANALVRELETDPAPAVISVADALFRMLPSITFRLESHMMDMFDLLRSDLYGRFPFLSKDAAISYEVVLPHAILSEAMTSVMELPGDETHLEVRDEMSHRLSTVASAFVFRHENELTKDSEQSVLHERNVVACELKRFLQQTTLLCYFAIEVKRALNECYYNHVHTLKQAILDDFQHKNACIASVMNDMRRTSRAVWPISVMPLDVPTSLSVKPLSQAYQNKYLSLAHLRALIQALRPTEEPSASPGSFARTRKTEFVTQVLHVATQEKFPLAWQDASAVASLAVQLTAASSDLVCWRTMVLSLLCQQFLDFPPLEFLLEFQMNTRKLPAETLDGNDFSAAKSTISWNEFERLPMWFDTRIRDTMGHEARELLFSLFANPDVTPIGESISASVMPMLLCWSAYPSSTGEIHSDLESLLPAFSRGLFRAFHVLLRWDEPISNSPRLKAELVDELWRFAGIPVVTGDTQEQVSDWGEHDVLQFLRYCDASPHADRLKACFALPNPLQILSAFDERRPLSPPS